MKWRLPWLVSPILLVLFIGCRQDDQIQTYRVSKESDAPPVMGQSTEAGMPSGSDMAPAASPKEIQWKVPEGWQARPPSAMRVGSFLIKGDDGQSCDVSVVPLSGPAGGNLANINRWRGQINLQPITDAELSKASETIHPHGRSMLLVDFDGQGKRVIAAIYTQDERTWFFKMMGDDQMTEAAKPAFFAFLKSLRFNAS